MKLVFVNDECSEVGLEEIFDIVEENKFYEVEEIIDVCLNW